MFLLFSFRRRGEAIATEQKFGAAQNKHTATTLNTTKLDRETEELKHDRVPLEIGKIIQKGRNDKVKFVCFYSDLFVKDFLNLFKFILLKDTIQ